MRLFQALVDQYFGRKPHHFDRIAPRLRDGKSSLEVRRELTNRFDDLSRLQAGKLVRDVERSIRAWRTCLGTGMGAMGIAITLFSPLNPLFALCMVFGLAQTVAGMKGMHIYRRATHGSNQTGEHASSA